MFVLDFSKHNKILFCHQVVGLGNHGMAGTRHSVGMAAVNLLARRLNVADQWKSDKQSKADIIQTQIDGQRVVLLKPRQLMNINGKSVARAAEKYHLTPGNIYLLHDELDKPIGKVSLKLGGSARGHNGVRSCIEYLQSDVMVRLLVGIGRPVHHSSIVRHVLEPFTRPEQEILPQVLEQGVDMVLAHIRQRIRTESPNVTIQEAGGDHK
ncbi:probable peptidyl-tRNA hydrolase [Spea bombifrons]|uniref:probable peptidyl-tRNA hydrolase n=1 Tax=Spea bombifrons TaxID=233779 RepID=UPI00234B7100|nr:probable peptidyl-tRNA hydrolase [Spea bombifrons]